MKTLTESNWNGRHSLREVVKQSEYGSAEQAVASLAAFTHPDTIRQLRGENIFVVIRGKASSERSTIRMTDTGARVMLDDNLAPIDAFLWANKLYRSKLTDIQFNHIRSDSQNVNLFTNLVNLCALPAFLSKLTDTDNVVKALLEYRAYDLYEQFSSHIPKAQKPAGYDDLLWADLLPKQEDVEYTIRLVMKTKPKSRTVLSAGNLGWVFSKDEIGGYVPDSSL